MPTSISGYQPYGPVERSFLAVYGQGSVSKASDFSYLLGDCASVVQRCERTDRRVLLLVLVETAASPVVSNQCMYRVK